MSVIHERDALREQLDAVIRREQRLLAHLWDQVHQMLDEEGAVDEFDKGCKAGNNTAVAFVLHLLADQMDADRRPPGLVALLDDIGPPERAA